MSNDGQCPIWGTEATVTERGDYFYDVSSPRAGGLYSISRSVVEDMRVKLPSLQLKAMLTTWITDQNAREIWYSEITAGIIEQIRQRQPLPVHERADRLLKYLETKSSVIGQEIHFFLDNSSAKEVFLEMLAWSESTSPEELDFLLNYLEKCDWVNKTVSSGGLNSVVLTVAGYARRAELDTKLIISSQGFVAMWFDDEMTEAYEKGIAPGIEDAGYKPVRIDKKDFLNKIDDEIIAEIRRSRFVVSDFTADRGGVYYEAGFAHGLSIPVIFTCREDKLNNIHFDTRQFPHIVWKTPDDLRAQLATRISAVIGDGPSKKYAET